MWLPTVRTSNDIHQLIRDDGLMTKTVPYLESADQVPGVLRNIVHGVATGKKRREV